MFDPSNKPSDHDFNREEAFDLIYAKALKYFQEKLPSEIEFADRIGKIMNEHEGEPFKPTLIDTNADAIGKLCTMIVYTELVIGFPLPIAFATAIKSMSYKIDGS